MGVVAAVVVLTAGTLTAVALAAGPKDAAVQYSAPFVCGWVPPADEFNVPPVKPGNYATAINIHNPTTLVIQASKRVALHYRMDEPQPPSIPFHNFTIGRNRVLEVDCNDIWAMVGVPPETFLKGALHIGLPQPLPVAAIHTSQTDINFNLLDPPDAGAGISIDVEHILPFQLDGVLGD